MKIEQVEGIILQDTNYSESSKILNILTKEYGLIGVLSKGCRNIKNKLRAVSRKLVHATFHIYYKENGLSTLIAADVISSYSNILTDLNRITYASYILELTTQVLKDNKEESVFHLLKNSLEKIDNKLDPMVITNILEIKYLDLLGVGLVLDSCSICGSNKNIITIDGTYGGLICSNCYKDSIIIDEKTIKLIRMFYYVDISKIDKIDLSEESIKQVNKFVEDYYDRYTGIYLKSKNMINKLTKLVTT